MSKIETVANEAIFQLQLNSRDAVKYVSRNAQCSREDAQAAINSVMTSYKK